MGKYFGTDGVRGKANETLTNEMVYKIGRFLGSYYKSGKIIIAKDTRLSSDMFEHMMASGIMASGCDAYLLGYCSTPALAYTTKNEKFNVGVMISASHNPYYDNGVKIFSNNGFKLKEDIEILIEDYIDGKFEIEYAKLNEIGRLHLYHDAVNNYVEYVTSLFKNDLSNLKLLADLSNGSCCYTAKKIFEKKALKVDYINDNPNGLNINLNCGSTHLEDLKNKIIKGDYDLGFAFDGDGDRMLMVTRNAEVVDGDLIMYMMANLLKAENKLKHNTVVTTVMSNIGLYKALDKKGIAYKTVSVGDKYVLESLDKNGYSLGGEQSGHIINQNVTNFGDGVISCLSVLEAMVSFNKNIEEFIQEVKIYPQLLKNIIVKDKQSVLASEKLKLKIKEVEKYLSANGRILVRASGTEPLIRVMVEAETDEICHTIVDDIIELIKGL